MAVNKNMQRAPIVLMVSMMMMMMSVQAANTTDCNSLLTELTPCLPFVADQTNTPSRECCSGLADVVKANVSCLCLVLSNPAVPNITRAEELPALCNVTVPNPATACPAAAPVPQAAPTTSKTPSTTNDNDATGPTPDMGVSSAFSLETFSMLPFLMTILACTILLQGTRSVDEEVPSETGEAGARKKRTCLDGKDGTSILNSK